MSDLLSVALKTFGIAEIPGKENNKQILKWAFEIGATWVVNEETSWCSIWLSAMCKACGWPYPSVSPETARSWLKVGNPTSIIEAVMGETICVFWRGSPDSWKGHVGIFLFKRGDMIYVLGGNQDNEVCIKAMDSKKLISLRNIKP